MSLEQYNNLVSDMFGQRQALAKLRAELERKERRLCRYCRRFGHIARKYRSRQKKKERMVVLQNKFEMLRNRVMNCGV